MQEITEYAYAKLNLSLDVVSRLQSGYHELCMVMQSVSLCDDVTLSMRADDKISIKTDLYFLPNNERNIAFKAAQTFFDKTGLRHGVDIDIKKRIPVCAGMGGGSADGAAVLRALNKMNGLPLSANELEELGASVGSDIPFCISGGTALAKGRGEKLTELPAIPQCKIIICKPRFSVSTPELFSRIDRFSIKLRPDTAGMLERIESRDLAGIARHMYNVFEDVLPPKPSDVAEIKRTLLNCGALGAVMTGTGSAVFGVFDDDESASAAFNQLRAQYTSVFSVLPKERIKIG